MAARRLTPPAIGARFPPGLDRALLRALCARPERARIQSTGDIPIGAADANAELLRLRHERRDRPGIGQAQPGVDRSTGALIARSPKQRRAKVAPAPSPPRRTSLTTRSAVRSLIQADATAKGSGESMSTRSYGPRPSGEFSRGSRGLLVEAQPRKYPLTPVHGDQGQHAVIYSLT